MIVIVLGLPGSGKSYFASRLAKMIDADYLNSDRIRKELFAHRTYSEKEKKAVYAAMLTQANETLARGRNLVLDATFHKKETRDHFLKQLSGRGEVFYIGLQADENTIKARLKKNRPYSEADFKVHQMIQQEWEPLGKDHLRLQSTNENIDDMLQNALHYLNDDKRSNR